MEDMYFDYITDLKWAEETKQEVYEQGLESYPLRTLAWIWAEELGKTGLSEVDATSLPPPKRGEKAYDLRLERLREGNTNNPDHVALRESLFPVRLDNS